MSSGMATRGVGINLSVDSSEGVREPSHSPAATAAEATLLSKWVDWGFLVLVWAAASVRMYLFTDRYAVNVLMLDQWDYFLPVFREEGLWSLFTFKHGPHRQGLGFLMTYGVFSLTHWNSRAEAFLNCFLLIGIPGLLLWLKRRLFGRLKWYDALLPMLVLSPLQLDHLVVTINPSHSVVPLMLVICLLHTWISESRWIRYGASVVVMFFAVFTGFGLFAGPAAMVVFAIGLYRGLRFGPRMEARFAAGALLAGAGVIALFLHNYTVDAAVVGWKFPDPNWQLYPSFVAIAVGNILVHEIYDPTLVQITGWLVLALVFASLSQHGFSAVQPARSTKELQDRRLNDTVVFLMLFGLMFTADIAVGRLVIGLEAGRATRYYALLCTLYFALYFAVLRWRHLRARIFLLAVLLMCTTKTCVFIDAKDQIAIEYYSTVKRAFAKAARQTGSATAAVKASNRMVYPDAERINMQAKFQYMRDRHLNLFSDPDE